MASNMVSPNPKWNLFCAGLGPHGPSIPDLAEREVPGAEIKDIVNRNFELAVQNGFNCDVMTLNPHDVPPGMEELRRRLPEKHYDAVLIGYGVRTSDILTGRGILEAVVNTIVELSPHSKILFDAKPGEVWPVLERSFAKELEAAKAGKL